MTSLKCATARANYRLARNATTLAYKRYYVAVIRHRCITAKTDRRAREG